MGGEENLPSWSHGGRSGFLRPLEQDHLRLFMRGLKVLIKAIIFDVDGTLYDETIQK